MTSKLSLLSAALAISAFTALPALAQSAPAVSTESGVHADVSKSGADAGTKTQTATHKKAVDKKATDKDAAMKPHEQVAQHPGDAPKAKTDSTVKTDSSTSIGK
jgi:hypothetical protein